MSLTKSEEHPVPKHLQGSQEDHRDLLQIMMDLARMIAPLPVFEQRRTAKPILWHAELLMVNVYVSEKDPTMISALIDWHSTSVSPMFLQVGWPEFYTSPTNHVKGLAPPKLPNNYKNLKFKEKKNAKRELKREFRAKAWELGTYRHNMTIGQSLWVPDILKEVFLRCGNDLDDGVIPLRQFLLQMSHQWTGLGLPGTAPFTLTDQELTAHQAKWEEYCQWYEIQEAAREALDADWQGWVNRRENWKKKQAQNKALFTKFAEKMALENPGMDAAEMWPFPVHSS